MLGRSPTWGPGALLFVVVGTVSPDARSQEPSSAESPAAVIPAEPPAAAAPADAPPGAPAGVDEEVDPLLAAARDVAARFGDHKAKLVVPGFRASTEDVAEGDLETMTGLVVYQLGKVPKFDVVSSADIQELLQLEAERAALGCSDSSCLSEIADALGAELVMAGQVGRLGPRWVIQLSLLFTPEARVIGRSQIAVRRLDELPAAVKRAVHEITLAFGGVPNFTADVAAAAAEAEARTSYIQRFADFATAPDTVMLLAVLAGGLVGLAGPFGFLAPVAQALILWGLGDDLAGRVYPRWWLAIPAGWGMYLLAALVTIVTAGGGAGAGAVGGGIGLFGGGVAAVGASVGVLIAFVGEPIVAWLAGTWGGYDLEMASEGEEPFAPNDNPEAGSDDEREAALPPPVREAFGRVWASAT